MAAGWRFLSVMALAIAGQAQSNVCNRSISEPLESAAAKAVSARAYELAARHFAEAFDACPGKRSILLALAQAQLSGRRFDEAVRTAERYLEGDRGSMEGRVILANAYFMSRRLKDAL